MREKYNNLLDEIKDIHSGQGFLCVLLFLNLFFGSCCSYGPDKELRQQVKNLQETVNTVKERQSLVIVNQFPPKVSGSILAVTKEIKD